MQTPIEKSGSFIASQFAHKAEMAFKGSVGPSVTISYQTGAGANEVAERLVNLLRQIEPHSVPAWAVLDRQLVEQALAEHHWPVRLANKMPEDKRSYVEDVLDDFFGLRPPSWVLVPQVVETMVRLAQAGHVVLIGRGATIVTAHLPNVFHVRLVAPLATRITRVQTSRNLTPEAALKFIAREDRGRRRYARAHFHARLEDDLLYHLVINTERLPFAEAAALIAEGARRHFRWQKPAGSNPASVPWFLAGKGDSIGEPRKSMEPLKVDAQP